jgi:replicative DNA helicase
MGTETTKKQMPTDKNNENTQETTENLTETQKILVKVVDEMENQIRTRDGFIGINTGFKKIDDLLQGLREGDLNIIASRPAIGKTSFALAMFSNITTQGINSLYISFDKYENEIIKSILSIKTNIDSMKLDSGQLTSSDFKKILATMQTVSDNNTMFIKSFNNTDVVKLKNFIKEKIEIDKIKIVFIDYLTMIIPAPTYSNRWEQVSEISRSLKSMAMEFKIPFIVLCPIHRNIVDSSPEIIDISESGSIEYEADRVLLLYKKPIGKKNISDFEDKENNKITVYIAKNRRGPTGTFDLLFDNKKKIIKDDES